MMIPSISCRSQNLNILLSLAIFFLSVNISPSLSPLSSPLLKPITASTKRNFTELSDSVPANAVSVTIGSRMNNQNQQSMKKLLRLPHVFGKVLELPFNSDADISVEARPDSFRFVASDDEGDICGGNGGGDVRVHIIEVHHGVKKAVIRKKNDSLGSCSDGYMLLINELELNIWRFRLPAFAQVELTKAVCVGGQLVVTVPKNGVGAGNRSQG